MPQANITYNTKYNRDLASRVAQMDEDMLWKNKHQYHPTPMGYRISSFHDAQGTANTPNLGRDYSGKLTGGAAPSKYILNGNSPAYPPANMNAGMAVSSGGGSHIGVDGAVSGGKGNFWSGFKRGFGDTMDLGAKAATTAATVLPVMKALSGRGRGRPKTTAGATSGGVQSGGSLFSLAARIAPIALGLLTGKGRKANITDKRAAIAEAIEGGNFWNSFKKGFGSVLGLAKKIAPVALPIMAQLGKKQFGGGFNFGKFLTKIGKTGVGKEVTRIGKPLVRKARKAIKENAPKATAAVKKVADKIIDNPMKTGSILEEAIEKTKPLIRKGKKELKKAIKENAPKATAYLKKKADRGIQKAVGGGRAARAAIVKKVMKEKGMKMIEASKYVKEHGLYKK